MLLWNGKRRKYILDDIFHLFLRLLSFNLFRQLRRKRLDFRKKSAGIFAEICELRQRL